MVLDTADALRAARERLESARVELRHIDDPYRSRAWAAIDAALAEVEAALRAEADGTYYDAAAARPRDRIPAAAEPLTPGQLRIFAGVLEAYVEIGHDLMPPTLGEILVLTVAELRRLHGAAPAAPDGPRSATARDTLARVPVVPPQAEP